MSEQSGLVEFGLSEPARFFRGEEDFDSNVLVAPVGLPNLAVATLADALQQCDLLRNRSLNLHKKKQRNKNNYRFLIK